MPITNYILFSFCAIEKKILLAKSLQNYALIILSFSEKHETCKALAIPPVLVYISLKLFEKEKHYCFFMSFPPTWSHIQCNKSNKEQDIWLHLKIYISTWEQSEIFIVPNMFSYWIFTCLKRSQIVVFEPALFSIFFVN